MKIVHEPYEKWPLRDPKINMHLQTNESKLGNSANFQEDWANGPWLYEENTDIPGLGGWVCRSISFTIQPTSDNESLKLESLR